jgi:23S rRNA (guanosine2251-2'-O)-methyltransferase
MTMAYMFGIHAVSALLKHQADTVEALLLLNGKRNARLKQVEQLAKGAGVAIRYLSQRELDHLVDGQRHQGVVVAMASMQPQATEKKDLLTHVDAIEGPPFLLILDGVQDPHNLGACLRSADAAGVHAVIVPKDKAVGLTPTVRKVASGAAETVPFFQVTNLARTLDQLKERGIWVMGSAAEASAFHYQEDFSVPLALVMGAEGKGMRRLTTEKCDHLLSIPMRGDVSVATGIFLFEVVRQRASER